MAEAEAEAHAEGELRQRVLRVGQNGGAHYNDVQTAIDAVALHNKQRVIIEIMPGVYKQPLFVPKTKNFITLRGSRREDTILTWDNTATRIDHHQDESAIGSGTSACGSVIIEGSDFIAEGITFENCAPQGSGQAVAIRVTSDRCAFYNCRFIGWQGTAYFHHGRQYLRDCYIEGSIDFIFGNATALLEHCHIHCKSSGWITAQSRRSEDDYSGFVFLRCVITGNGERGYAYLGRPCESFARVLFAYTWMDGSITPLGWHNWDLPEREETACFYEYRCSGPGSDCSQRVKWVKILEDDKIDEYGALSFTDPNPHKTWLTWFTNGM